MLFEKSTFCVFLSVFFMSCSQSGSNQESLKSESTLTQGLLENVDVYSKKLSKDLTEFVVVSDSQIQVFKSASFGLIPKDGVHPDNTDSNNFLELKVYDETRYRKADHNGNLAFGEKIFSDCEKEEITESINNKVLNLEIEKLKNFGFKKEGQSFLPYSVIGNTSGCLKEQNNHLFFDEVKSTILKLQKSSFKFEQTDKYTFKVDSDFLNSIDEEDVFVRVTKTYNLDYQRSVQVRELRLKNFNWESVPNGMPVRIEFFKKIEHLNEKDPDKIDWVEDRLLALPSYINMPIFHLEEDDFSLEVGEKEVFRDQSRLEFQVNSYFKNDNNFVLSTEVETRMFAPRSVQLLRLEKMILFPTNQVNQINDLISSHSRVGLTAIYFGNRGFDKELIIKNEMHTSLSNVQLFDVGVSCSFNEGTPQKSIIYLQLPRTDRFKYKVEIVDYERNLTIEQFSKTQAIDGEVMPIEFEFTKEQVGYGFPNGLIRIFKFNDRLGKWRKFHTYYGCKEFSAFNPFNL